MKKNFLLILFLVIFTLMVMIPYGSQRAAGGTVTAGSAGIDELNETEQIGPPWFDEAWHYRRPVTISSSVYVPAYYQVLIKLDHGNFNFTLANANGSDIRFTDSSGKNLISFWIESWDKQNELAYVWVLVSTIPPQPYTTTIYLYYNNPTATTASNGSATFDFFDDFLQFSGMTCLANGTSQINEPSSNGENIQDGGAGSVDNLILTDPWCVINGAPAVSSSILTLSNGTGIKTNRLFQSQEAVGYLANYGMGTGHEWIGFIDGTSSPQTVIGDLQADPDGLYLMNSANDSSAPLGVTNWHDQNHVYEVRWANGISTAYLDHLQQATNSSQVPTGYLPVSLYNDNGGTATTLKVDWLYVRQYHDPEPMANIGTEQGLVDLGIRIEDAPDPIRTGVELSYNLTITNTSTILAAGVLVTDTLPGNVQFVRASPSTDCNYAGGKVFCDLYEIAVNSTKSVSIVVKPTADGTIINSAIIGSNGYDVDMSNNLQKVTTLVDSVPPNVNWESPVHNGESYTTSDSMIGLEASATDNDQVAWVEFKYWDHINLAWVTIGIDNTYPYQWQFNCEGLVPNQEYQMFVVAADRAGNVSSIYTSPSPVIYVKRTLLHYFYLPLAIR